MLPKKGGTAKVNQDLAEQLEESKRMAEEEAQGLRVVRSNDKKKMQAQSKLVTDDRFGQLFQDDKFKIDRQSAEYRLLHPSETALERNAKMRGDVEEEDDDDDLDHFDAVEVCVSWGVFRVRLL